MRMISKKVNRIFAFLIVLAMIFTSNGMYTFANSDVVDNIIEDQLNLTEEFIDNNEEISNSNDLSETEETIEEETTEEETTDDIQEIIEESTSIDKTMATNEEEIPTETSCENEEIVEDEEVENTSEEIFEPVGDEEENEEETYEEEPEEDEETTDDIIEDIVSNEEVETEQENESDIENVVDNEKIETEETIENEEESEEETESISETTTEEYNNVEETTFENDINETIEDETIENDSFENEDSNNENQEETTTINETENIEENDNQNIDENLNINETIASVSNNVDETNENKNEYTDEILSSPSDAELVIENEDIPIVGVAPIKKDIILDFGMGPSLADSDYAGKTVSLSKFTDIGNNQYKLVGSGGVPIVNDLTDAPKEAASGSGEHVLLPTFGNIWTGYNFGGWEDADGVSLTRFNYAYQYELGEMTYTAVWNIDPSFKVNMKVQYKHKTPVSNPRDMATEETSQIVPGTIISKGPKTIAGYKISSYEVTCTGFDNTNIFKDKGYSTIYKDTQEPMSVDSSTYILYGAMPNHDLTLTYYYEPDIITANNFSVKWLDKADNTVIKSEPANTVKPEDIIEKSPESIIGYTFYIATVSSGYKDIEPVYPLGTYEVAGQTYVPGTTKLGADASGHFKAAMPNQKVELIFYYTKDAADEVPVTFTYKFEGRPDIVQSCTAHVNDEITFPLNRNDFPTNQELKGYGIPSYNAPGTTGMQVLEFNSTYADANVGQMKIKLTSNTTKSIVITFAYDYSRTNYWKKIAFQSNTLYGQVVASPSTSSPLTERFISIGTHNFSEFIQDVGLEPINEFYMFDGWYRGLNETIGKDPAYPNKLLPNSTITLTEAEEKITLYADFVEDPSKFVTISFELASEEHGHITLSPASYHVFNGTSMSGPEIVFPSVGSGMIVDTGFDFKGWTYTFGGAEYVNKSEADIIAQMPTAIENITFVGNIEYHVDDDGLLHKTPVKLTYANGKATAKVIGAFANERNYILTDKDGEILEAKLGLNAVSENFSTELWPGMKYNMYEVKNTVDITSVVGTNISAISSSDKSEPYNIHIPAVSNYQVTGNSTSGYSISFNAVSGVQYGLLKKDFSIQADFGNVATFTGLEDADHYIIVARKNGSTMSASDAIEQGVVAHTEQHDMTGRKYKVVLTGGEIQGMSTVETPLGSKVYDVNPGTSLTLKGTNNYKWSLDSGNVSFVKTDVMPTGVIMPQNDVYLTNKNVTGIYNSASLEVITNGLNIGVRDQDSVLKAFTDALPADTITNGYEVKYYIIFDKVGQNDSTSPYYITMNVYMTIQGILKEISLPSVYSSGLPVVYLFDKQILSNTNYKLYKNGSTSSVETGYSTTDQTKINSATFNMTTSDNIAITCDKTFLVKIDAMTTTATAGATGVVFSKTYNVVSGTVISAIPEYASEISPMMTDQIDDSQSTLVSSYYSLMNLYKGLMLLPTDTTGIDPTSYVVDKNLNLKLKYEEDTDRNSKKANLLSKINQATNTLSTEIGLLPVNATAINDALVSANNVKDTQITHTVAELQDEYDALNNVLENLVTTVNINIDGNGGTVSVSSLTPTINVAFSGLSSVTTEYTDMNFVHWNTSPADDGTTITSSTVIKAMHEGITLYAIWTSGEIPTPPPTPHPHSGGGGGGGGGGGMSRRVNLEQKYETAIGPVQQQTISNPMVDVSPLQNGTGMVFVADVDGKFFRDTSDIKNISMYFYMNNGQFLTNTWAQVSYNIDKDNKTTGIYHFGSDGKAETGFYVEGNNVYYLSKDINESFCRLQTGWIYDKQAQKWYYSNKQNGILATGYQIIDNKIYYFNTNVPKDNNGKLLIDNFNYGNGYGQLQIGGITPEGYVVNENGEVVAN